jgi:transcriptional regulator with XRE-family HTH domain
MIQISDAIRQPRGALGLDQPTVAEAAGVDPGRLSAYESGTEIVPGDVLWRFSEILGLPLPRLPDGDQWFQALTTQPQWRALSRPARVLVPSRPWWKCRSSACAHGAPVVGLDGRERLWEPPATCPERPRASRPMPLPDG